MPEISLKNLLAEIAPLNVSKCVGRIVKIDSGAVVVGGLSRIASLGDRVRFSGGCENGKAGEVVQLSEDEAIILPDGTPDGLYIGGLVEWVGQMRFAPDNSWIGRVIDPNGTPIDGRPIVRGFKDRQLKAIAPDATRRRSMGGRLETGQSAFNTLLPVARGQRIGLFSGSGVGKSSLLGQLANGIDADVVVIALIGERGREVGDFLENVLGVEGRKKSVVVAATSDASAIVRRRCAWSAMTIAEHFRDNGRHVLFLADSITRLAQAHTEVALAAGEAATPSGYPATLAHLIMSLCERAGPGTATSGDITAIFTVLVAGSNMEEPVADILRGVLDGHVVLDRKIAERGRFPAIDLLRSVSRSLPSAATKDELKLIGRARAVLGTYDRAELMIQSGLYESGSDPRIDEAIRIWPELDAFLARIEPNDTNASFTALAKIVAADDQETDFSTQSVTP